MKLKEHHKLTLEDGLKIVFYVGTDKYMISITKIMTENRYDLEKEYSTSSYTWFETIGEFYSWDNLQKRIDKLVRIHSENILNKKIGCDK